MLTNSPNAAASASAGAETKHARKADVADRPKHAAAAPIVIHEPRVDWVPLAWAPLRYNSHGYIRSAEKWGENLDVKVKEFAASISSRDDVHVPEYLFQPTKRWRASIKAVGITTIINAMAEVYVLSGTDPIVGGDPDEVLNDKRWKGFPRQQKPAARWHWSMLMAVLKSLRRDFVLALNTGSAHIVARQNTVLAPFERVAWDQWQYFKLDVPERTTPAWEDQQYMQPISSPVRWFDPRNCGWGRQGYGPSTATGPNGEKLYAIHVAPGVNRAESGQPTAQPSAEDKCTQWIVEYMTAFPERSPKTREALVEEAVSLFPGLTERGFGRALFIARRQTDNLKWLTAGRRPKSPQ